MRESKLIQIRTAHELLVEMVSSTKICYEGKYGLVMTGVTKPQREILAVLKIELPKSA
jgi:hypothetical protein